MYKRQILQAPVDLLWNGGVGTYVKATTESNADVGDKNNDTVRVDADELRCRVIGEGGNLGLTQRGRIQFALRGGRLNTEAIDNSAGVDCSDHEVNIKILLDRVVRDGDLTGKQRNALLAEMSDDIAARVLRNNDSQTRALTAEIDAAAPVRDIHLRYLDALERSGRLDRALELLPTAKDLTDRGESARLTTPELAVLLAYTKIDLFEQLLASDLPEDPFLSQELHQHFPDALRSRFAAQIADHPLRREIIATRVTNRLVDRAGTTFVFRMIEETGLGAADIARAYAAAREIFGLPSLWTQIGELDGAVPSTVQHRLFFDVRRVVELASRWLLRHRRPPLDIAATVALFSPGVPELTDRLPELLPTAVADTLAQAVGRHVDAGVPEPLARRVAALPTALSVLDITEIAAASGRPLADAATIHFALGEHLLLNWLYRLIMELPFDDRWQALARGTLRDSLFEVHAALTADVLREGQPGSSPQDQIRRWLGRTAATTNHCLRVLDDIASGERADLATLTVALREVGALAQAEPAPTDRPATRACS